MMIRESVGYVVASTYHLQTFFYCNDIQIKKKIYFLIVSPGPKSFMAVGTRLLYHQKKS